MDIIKKIIEKIKKSTVELSSHNIFNLRRRKIAKTMTLQDLDRLTDEELGNIPIEDIEKLKGGKSIELPDISNDRNIENRMVEYVRNMEGGLDVSNQMPPDVLQSVAVDPRKKQKMIDLITTMMGHSPDVASNFIDKMIFENQGGYSDAGLMETEESIEEPLVSEVTEPAEVIMQPRYLLDKFIKERQEQYNNMLVPISRSLDIEGYGGDPGEIRDRVMNMNFGAPSKNKITGQLNKDQRATFFFFHPDMFPKNSFNQMIKDPVYGPKLREMGVNAVEDLGKFVGRSKESSVLSNLLMEAVGQDIIQKLALLMQEGDPSIDQWAMRNYKQVSKPGGNTPFVQSLDVPSGGVSGEGTIQDLQRSNIKTPEEIAIEREEIERGEREELSHGGEGLEKQLSPEEQKEMQRRVKDLKELNLMPLLELFSKVYLEEIMRETNKLGEGVRNSLLQEAAKAKSENKKNKLGDTADRLQTALSVSLQQIAPFFERQEGYAPGSKILPEENAILYWNPKHRHNRIKIPRDALFILKNEIENKTGKNIFQAYSPQKGVDPEVMNIIQDIAKRSASQWIPDWDKSNWVQLSALKQRLNQLGRIKKHIKIINKKLNDISKEDLNTVSSPETIYENLSPQEKEILDETIPLDMRNGFIQRTLKQPDEGMGSIEKNWEYAAFPDPVFDNTETGESYFIPRDEDPRDKAKNKFKKQIDNDPSIPPELKERKKKELEDRWADIIKRGHKNPKARLQEDAKFILPLLYDLKQQGNFGDSAFKSFLGLVPPHPDMFTGRGAEGREYGKSLKEGKLPEDMSYTELLHYLRGTMEDLPIDTRLRMETSEANKRKVINQIKDNPENGPMAKEQKIDQLKTRWEKIENILKLYRIYRVLNKKLQQGLIKPDKIEEKTKQKEQALQQIRQLKIDPGYQNKDIQELLALAHSKSFRMVYSMYLKEANLVSDLFSTLHKYKNIKIASSHCNEVEKMIENIIVKYEILLNV